jgi:hypothetical protein
VKRPAYQWYPGDHRRDTALQACSWEARALWRDLLDIMHDGDPYGHLAVNGRAIPLPRVAGMIGLTLTRLKRYLAELEVAGVPSRNGNILFSRRMIRDENVRERRAAGGAESLKNPHVPRPKKDISKDILSGPTAGWSFAGSPALAVAGSVASSVASAEELNSSSRDRFIDSDPVQTMLGQMTHLGASALAGYLQSAREPARLFAELEMIMSGLHGPGGRPVPAAVLGAALHAARLAGLDPPTEKRHAKFIRREIEPDPDPPRNGSSHTEALGESEFMRAARLIEEKEARERERGTHV